MELDVGECFGPPLNVLDLFSGLGGWTQAFEARGHDVTTVDNHPDFGATIQEDVLSLSAEDLDMGRPYDTILASPPCEKFSVAQIGRNWTKDHQPKNDEAAHALHLVQHTVHLIHDLAPDYWFLENPRAKLRRLPGPHQDAQHVTVTWCQYGDWVMKPTDIWGKFPATLDWRPPCKNGAPCHVSAPRGSTTGTQGRGTAATKAKLPFGLSWDVCLAVEQAFHRKRAGAGVQSTLKAVGGSK